MTRGFLPNTDNKLLAWSARFGAAVAASPATYGVSPAVAADLLTLHDAYAAGLAACAPAIRSQTSTATKNAARDALKRAARQMACCVNGQAAVDDAMKVRLGLTVRASPTAIPPPSTAPALHVVSTVGRTVNIKLRDPGSNRRGIPPRVSGASVFSFAGIEPSNDLADWQFEGNVGRSTATVRFRPTLPPGTQVWLLAFWFNGRKQRGPSCSPVSTQVHGGTVSMAA